MQTVVGEDEAAVLGRGLDQYLRDLRLTLPIRRGDWQTQTNAVIRSYRRPKLATWTAIRVAGVYDPSPAQGFSRLHTVFLDLDDLLKKEGQRPDWLLRHAAPLDRGRLAALTYAEGEADRRPGGRWYYVLAQWQWTCPEGEAGHATLFVFDLFEHTYTMWDPGDGRVDISSPDRPGHTLVLDRYALCHAAATECHAPLAPGYRYIGLTAHPVGAPCLQGAMELPHFPSAKDRHLFDTLLPPRGLCLTACLWVLACCLRFAFGRPFWFGRLLRERLEDWTSPQTTACVIRLLWWHRRLYSQGNTWPNLERALGLRPLTERPGHACGVYDEGSGRFCAARPCDGHVFCADHRAGLLGAAPRCEATIPWEAARGGVALVRPAKDSVVIDLTRKRLLRRPRRRRRGPTAPPSARRLARVVATARPPRTRQRRRG